MKIYFDVDDTLITWDVRLRPGVHDVFTQLREDGHDIYLWSGYGPRWEVVRRFELHEQIIDCFWKPLYDHHALGPTRMLASPLSIDGNGFAPAPPTRPFGSDTMEILVECGFTHVEAESLAADGVVIARP